MIIDIENIIMTKLKTELSDIEVVSGEQYTEVFPRVVLSESTNVTHVETVDSSGEKMNEVSLDINIYTIGDTKKSISKSIRKRIDDIMSGEYNMDRTFSNPTPNYFDKSIYRYTLRYSTVVDGNYTLYRR